MEMEMPFRSLPSIARVQTHLSTTATNVCLLLPHSPTYPPPQTQPPSPRQAIATAPGPAPAPQDQGQTSGLKFEAIAMDMAPAQDTQLHSPTFVTG